MKVIYSLSLLAALCAGFNSVGCTESHTESDKTGMMGGRKHEETTVTKNPITGERSVEHNESKTNP